MSAEGRLVWITCDDDEWIAYLLYSTGLTSGQHEWLESLRARRDAAPANTAEAVRGACFGELEGYVSPNHSQEVAAAVLRALGVPGDAT